MSVVEDLVSKEVGINLNGKEIKLPLVVGSEGEKGINISELRKDSGYITLDYGYMNTGACESEICFIDGEKGILRYYGIPIEQLAEQSTFLETSFLLLYGKLPTQKELDAFSQNILENAALPESFGSLYDGFAKGTHPMAQLGSVIGALSGVDPNAVEVNPSDDQICQMTAKLMGAFTTIAAQIYRKNIGKPFVNPNPKYSYTENLLHMMFDGTDKESNISKEAIRALDMLLILHADHEQNCSTSAVQLVGSSRANLYASISAGISALWGPWHGGANQEVMEMLESIHASGGDIEKYVKIAEDPKSNVRLSGFGHRVYKTFDPRAKVIKSVCDEVLDKLGVEDPLLDIARKLEATALKEDYFIQRKLYPNVDFYSGIIYKAIGIPTNMFTVLFAMGRNAGWISHWKEMRKDHPPRIGRPRQIYTGPTKTDYTPIEKRS